MLREINFDGIIGPSHNYAGLSLGNLASAANAQHVSEPRAAALQGIEKMRHNVRLGLAKGIFVHLPRPNHECLSELAQTAEEAPDSIRTDALTAPSTWAAQAATLPHPPATAAPR